MESSARLLFSKPLVSKYIITITELDKDEDAFQCARNRWGKILLPHLFKDL